jgi:hypothetical protein
MKNILLFLAVVSLFSFVRPQTFYIKITSYSKGKKIHEHIEPRVKVWWKEPQKQICNYCSQTTNYLADSLVYTIIHN